MTQRGRLDLESLRADQIKITSMSWDGRLISNADRSPTDPAAALCPGTPSTPLRLLGIAERAIAELFGSIRCSCSQLIVHAPSKTEKLLPR
eukprot:4588401-Pyramimonas_sp.AAC.1